MDILLDASAIMTIILNEPNREMVVNLTENSTLLSPDIISFEIGNALSNLFKRHKITEKELFEAYGYFSSIPVRTVDVNIEKALKIACKYFMYAYDAYYLEVALRLKLPLITFDEQMKNAALNLKITVLDKPAGMEEKNESI